MQIQNAYYITNAIMEKRGDIVIKYHQMSVKLSPVTALRNTCHRSGLNNDGSTVTQLRYRNVWATTSWKELNIYSEIGISASIHS